MRGTGRSVVWGTAPMPMLCLGILRCQTVGLAFRVEDADKGAR
jgi:hypothetical protein